jgi:hypothetical protein
MKKQRRVETPILDKLIADKVVFAVENGEYIGQALDGVFVQLGYTHDKTRVEKYLMANPTPDKW